MYLVGERLPQDVLVQGTSKIGIDDLIIKECLAHDSPSKFEKVQVVGS